MYVCVGTFVPFSFLVVILALPGTYKQNQKFGNTSFNESEMKDDNG